MTNDTLRPSRNQSSADFQVALSKRLPMSFERLTAERVGEHFECSFRQLSPLQPGCQRVSHSPFQPADEALCQPSLAITAFLQMRGTHLGPPPPVPLPVRPLTGRFNNTLYAPVAPALLMNPFGVITGIGVK